MPSLLSSARIFNLNFLCMRRYDQGYGEETLTSNVRVDDGLPHVATIIRYGVLYMAMKPILQYFYINMPGEIQEDAVFLQANHCEFSQLIVVRV